MANPQAEYTRRLLQSRIVRDKVIEKQAQRVRKLLEELYSEIDDALASGSLKSYTSWQRSGVQKAIGEILETYSGVLENQIALASEGTVERVVAIRTAATEEYMKAVSGGSLEDLPTVAGINTVSPDVIEATIARMYPDGLVLSDRVWQIAQGARKGIEQIVAKGIIQGESAKSISMKLRFYVRGAEAVPREYLLDLRRLPRVARESRIQELMEVKGIERNKALQIANAEVQQMRGIGKNIAYRSYSLARSEVNASYHEAHIAGAIKSPVVKGQKWNLSGSHPRYDECDIVASANYYDLGPGVYPIGQTPHRAHTNCLCYLTDILRPREEWEEPKPSPDLKRDPMKAKYSFEPRLTNAQRKRYRERAAHLVNSGDRVARARAAELV